MTEAKNKYMAHYMAMLRSSDDPHHRMILLRQYWHFQKNAARRRGVEFLLTFEEWFKIWNDSGHLQEKGRLKHQYCMSRHGDKGPYAVGNVEIITNAENKARQIHPWIGRKHTDATRAKLAVSKRGNDHGAAWRRIDRIMFAEMLGAS
jgi:hypothetical protein